MIDKENTISTNDSEDKHEEDFDEQLCLAISDLMFLEIGDKKVSINKLARMLGTKPGPVRLIHELDNGKSIIATNEDSFEHGPSLSLRMRLANPKEPTLRIADVITGIRGRNFTCWLYNRDEDGCIGKFIVDSRPQLAAEEEPLSPHLRVYGNQRRPTVCHLSPATSTIA